ncbi:hypothetical protein FRC06_006947, partial [Ceratobasidium sp. 370]
PFLSPRPLSEEAMRIDATTDPAQPTHSSHIIRRYRTLAFRVARASALQITSLIRHIPLSSPCVTLPYVIYSACTILLLAPDDQAAMDGVRTGIACLESMDESGYWVNSAKDGKDRIQALAKRWGVNISPAKKVLGHLGAGGPSGPGGGSGASGPGGAGPSTSKGHDHGGSKSTGTHGGSSAPSAATGTRSSATTGSGSNRAAAGVSSGAAHTQAAGSLEPALSQEYAGTSNQTDAGSWDSGYSNKAGMNQGTAAPPSYDEAVAPQAHGHPTGPQHYAPQQSAGYSDGVLASGMVQPSQTEAYTQPQPHAANYIPGHPQQPAYSGQQQPTQYQQPAQYQPQQVVQHVHYHVHSHTHHHSHQYQHTAPQNTYHLPKHPPHVAYGFSHAEPQHDFHLPHTHWHQVLPPADPSLPFPPDPIACTDIAMCFADTVRTGQDPAFVQNMTDPYASVAADWFLDSQNNFALITPEMYGDGGIPSAMLDAGAFEAYAQGPAQKSYVTALEARVTLLENILKNAGVGDAVGVLELTTITEHQPGPRNTPTAMPAPTLAPTVSTPAEVEPNDQSDDLETGFVPSDDAANALESISLVNPEEGKVLDSSHALDLGMGGYVPLVSLEAEHKMLAQFWDWQRMHMPYVAPVPFLSAYAIHSEATHPNEPIPPPPPPPNSLAGPSAIDVPRAASVELTTDLVQFISPLLLDSMFAIAALFHGDPETSERFYRRAETRVIHESASPRLATVQAMLIMATWELGHARAPANWTLI